jgi:hypothetical protein
MTHLIISLANQCLHTHTHTLSHYHTYTHTHTPSITHTCTPLVMHTLTLTLTHSTYNTQPLNHCTAHRDHKNSRSDSVEGQALSRHLGESRISVHTHTHTPTKGHLLSYRVHTHHFKFSHTK